MHAVELGRPFEGCTSIALGHTRLGFARQNLHGHNGYGRHDIEARARMILVARFCKDALYSQTFPSLCTTSPKKAHNLAKGKLHSRALRANAPHLPRLSTGISLGLCLPALDVQTASAHQVAAPHAWASGKSLHEFELKLNVDGETPCSSNQA